MNDVEAVMHMVTEAKIDAIDDLRGSLIGLLPQTHLRYVLRSDISAWLEQIDASTAAPGCSQTTKSPHTLANFGIYDEKTMKKYRTHCKQCCRPSNSSTAAVKTLAKLSFITQTALPIRDMMKTMTKTSEKDPRSRGRLAATQAALIVRKRRTEPEH